MANDHASFDEKDALLKAGALNVRAPTLQKARIRRRYARQFQKEALKTEGTDASQEETASALKGGTEGSAISLSDQDLQEKQRKKYARRRLAPGGRHSDKSQGSSAAPAGFFSQRTTNSAVFFHETGSSKAAFGRGDNGPFSLHPSPALQPRQTASDYQKAQLKKSYVTKRDSVYIPVVTRIKRRLHLEQAEETEKAAVKAAETAAKHPLMATLMACALLFIFLITSVSSAGIAVAGEVLVSSVTATSYSADDEDILGAEADYRALEADLRRRMADPESSFPGYSSYDVHNTEISHDPYRLAALLTVLHERFTRAEVQATLRQIFDLQYTLATEDTTGTSTTKTVRVGESLGVVVTSGYCNCAICCGKWAGGHTASGVYPQANHTIAVDSHNPIVPMGTKVIMNGVEYTVEDTGPLERYGVAFDVYYDDHATAQNHGHKRWEAFLADDNGDQTVTVTVVNNEPTLKVILTNHGLDRAARALLNDDLYERYELLIETKGNRDDLFPDYNAISEYAGLTYVPPGSALSDARFANLYNEAVKHLGTPYVWGGESPSGFDCSGFVSYVINNCGNGWSYGRLTAEEWRLHTMAVSPADARPGDLVFFQGTYDTVGASHIGIYLGDGMMIHAGKPVQIASINTPYFQQHFLSFGRLAG